eukprot:NODE_8_length_47770_cov_0.334354.p21 type:complete len:129 gc:universal NODE_8_length_47770_cov_0.334354:24714-25100(+)
MPIFWCHTMISTVSGYFVKVDFQVAVFPVFIIYFFVSDSIIQILFWKKLRMIKYYIGSDIEASVTELRELRKLFLIRIGVACLAYLTIEAFDVLQFGNSYDDNDAIHVAYYYIIALIFAIFLPSFIIM